MSSTAVKLRKFHSRIAPILFLPLLLSTLTGIGYRVGRTWFGLSKDFGNVMMILHEGRFLGKPLVPLYVLFTGLGLLGLAITGITMLKWKRAGQRTNKPAKFSMRSLHRWLAPLFFLPFFVSAITGIVYRVGKVWLHLPAEYTKLLLKIHQGAYLGSTLRVYYILFIGIGLMAMLVTGLQMTSIFRKRHALDS